MSIVQNFQYQRRDFDYFDYRIEEKDRWVSNKQIEFGHPYVVSIIWALFLDYKRGQILTVQTEDKSQPFDYTNWTAATRGYTTHVNAL